MRDQALEDDLYVVAKIFLKSIRDITRGSVLGPMLLQGKKNWNFNIS